MSAVTPAITRLTELGVEFGVHEYDRGDDVRDFGREAAEALGLPLDQVYKTLLVDVVGGRRGDETIVVVVPVGAMASLKSVAIAVGAKRAAMCDPARAERLTGYVVGGISPIGQRSARTTVVDERALAFDRVYVSGGKRGLDVSLDPRDLIAATAAITADVTA